MNFQEARNLEGKKNAKGYQAGVSMSGTVQAIIDPQRIFTTNGKPTQRIQLLDDLGESCKVKVFLGNGPDILAADVRTVQSFSDLAMNRYKGQVSYMAFWDNMHPPQGQPQPSTELNSQAQAIIDQQFKQPAVGQQVQAILSPQAPAPAQQPVPVVGQGGQPGAYTPPRQAPPAAQPDWDEIARGKVRCKLVCAAIQSGQLEVSCEDDFEGWMGYIFNGVQVPGDDANPDYNPNPAPPKPGDDVPF